ncbi:MAG: outer membrane protein [Devosia sp.]
MNNVFAAAALVALLASPAFAADLVIDTPKEGYPTLGSDNWSGFYVGLYGGYGLGNASTLVGVIPDDIPLSGGMLGAAAGFNHQIDRVVLGVEGDVAWMGAAGTSLCADNIIFECSGSLDWLATLRARAGVAYDSALIYATAGVAVAGGTATVEPAPLFATGEFSDTFVGWTAGFGAELKLTDNISARAEYAFTDLGTRTAPQGTLTTMGETEISPYLNTVKLGLNFAF